MPLLAFLPDALAARYVEGATDNRSTGQIFPATLIWMGFDEAVAEARYDYDLTRPTARYVWFGRKVVPLQDDDYIEINSGQTFPGAE